MILMKTWSIGSSQCVNASCFLSDSNDAVYHLELHEDRRMNCLLLLLCLMLRVDSGEYTDVTQRRLFFYRQFLKYLRYLSPQHALVLLSLTCQVCLNLMTESRVVAFLLAALTSLPAPVNLSVKSVNFRHVLRWDPGPGTPPGTEYRVYKAVRWIPPAHHVVGCSPFPATLSLLAFPLWVAEKCPVFSVEFYTRFSVSSDVSCGGVSNLNRMRR